MCAAYRLTLSGLPVAQLPGAPANGNVTVWDDIPGALTVVNRKAVPQPGDIAQWDLTQSGGTFDGHVAHVEAVERDATLETSGSGCRNPRAAGYGQIRWIGFSIYKAWPSHFLRWQP